MSAMEMGKTTGMLIGLLFGLALTVLILRYVNSDRRTRTEYDEMQKIIRGDGYRIAFVAVMVMEALCCLTDSVLQRIAEPIVIHFTVILMGVLVQAGYCVWKGAYVGQNTKLNRFIVVCVLITILNFAMAYLAFRGGNMLQDGVLQAPFVNFLCGLMFTVLGVVGLIRKLTDREVEV